LISNNVKMSK